MPLTSDGQIRSALQSCTTQLNRHHGAKPLPKGYRLYGHLMRLPVDTPVRKAMVE